MCSDPFRVRYVFRALAPIKRKIVAAFSESYQPKIRSLRQRILIGQPASKQVLASFVSRNAARSSASQRPSLTSAASRSAMWIRTT